MNGRLMRGHVVWYATHQTNVRADVVDHRSMIGVAYQSLNQLEMMADISSWQHFNFSDRLNRK
jgi:hypothetical protein